jgi:hypothetical protein
MLRKRASRRAAGKQKNGRGTNVQRRAVSATADTVPVARDRATAAGAVEARLQSAAKEIFKNMGED